MRCTLKYTKGKKASWRNWGFAFLNILSLKAELFFNSFEVASFHDLVCIWISLSYEGYVWIFWLIYDYAGGIIMESWSSFSKIH